MRFRKILWLIVISSFIASGPVAQASSNARKIFSASAGLLWLNMFKVSSDDAGSRNITGTPYNLVSGALFIPLPWDDWFVSPLFGMTVRDRLNNDGGYSTSLMVGALTLGRVMPWFHLADLKAGAGTLFYNITTHGSGSASVGSQSYFQPDFGTLTAKTTFATAGVGLSWFVFRVDADAFVTGFLSPKRSLTLFLRAGVAFF